MTDTIFASIPLLRLCSEEPTRTGLKWSAFIHASDLSAVASNLLAAEYHLEDICGLDSSEGLFAIYHFDRMSIQGRLALHVAANGEPPSIPSISSIYQGAEWHERETADFYGIRFEGNPNPAPLLLPEGMQGYPLRKVATARANLRTLLAAPERGAKVLAAHAAFTILDDLTEPVGEAPDAATATTASVAEDTPHE